MKTVYNDTQLSEDVLKSLALMQYNDEDYFIINTEDEVFAFEGKREDARKGFEADIEGTEEVDIDVNFLIYCQNNLTQVEDFDNDDYLVLDDDEADEKAKERITDSLWAFNPSFLAEMTDFDEEVFQAIVDNGKCESNNDVIYNTIVKTCGIDTFVEAAISADGRGHFMSSYDGEETEETVKDEFGEGHTYFVYRLN